MKNFVVISLAWLLLACPIARSGEFALLLKPFEGPAVVTVEQALAKEKIKAQDISWLKHELTESFQGLAIGNLLANRPRNLPTSLQKDWDEGIERCKKVAGPPPYGIKNQAAFLCGRSLGRTLWNRFLEEKKFDQFLEIEIELSPDPTMYQRIQVTTYRPQEPTAQFLETGSVSRDKAAEKLAEMIRRTLAGEGQKKEHVESSELPPRQEAPLPKDQAYDLPALPLPDNCENLPQTLRISPEDSSFGQTLVGLYNASVASRTHTGPELNCRFELWDMGNILPSSKQHQYIAHLICGPQKWQYKTYNIFPLHSKKVYSSLANGLLRAFFAEKCKNP